MNLKLQWLQPGEPVQGPTLCFSFDSPQALFASPERALEIEWLKTGEAIRSNHILAISGLGVSGFSPDFTYWEKGELEDGTRRYVYPLFNDPALPFRAGLTLHATRGTWSSLPHEFEARDALLSRPASFYEQFAFITEEPWMGGVVKRNGFLFDPEGNPEKVNDILNVRDRDIVSIPLGAHPVSGDPGVKIGYFWVYWGNLEGREKFTKDKAL